MQQGVVDYRNSPFFADMTRVIQGLVQNPYTFSPTDAQAMYANNAAQANANSNAALQNLYEKNSASGAGFRSGGTRAGEFDILSRQGSDLTAANTQTQLQLANQNRADQTQLINTLGTYLGNQFGLSQSVANAELGSAGVFSQLANVPSPAAQSLGGVGKIGGSILTAGTSPSGVFKG